MNELKKIAEYLNGDLNNNNSIIIHTDDNTAKENYDNLLDIPNDIKSMLCEYEIVDLWADHDTQIITFNKTL